MQWFLYSQSSEFSNNPISEPVLCKWKWNKPIPLKYHILFKKKLSLVQIIKVQLTWINTSSQYNTLMNFKT